MRSLRSLGENVSEDSLVSRLQLYRGQDEGNLNTSVTAEGDGEHRAYWRQGTRQKPRKTREYGQNPICTLMQLPYELEFTLSYGNETDIA